VKHIIVNKKFGSNRTRYRRLSIIVFLHCEYHFCHVINSGKSKITEICFSTHNRSDPFNHFFKQ